MNEEQRKQYLTEVGDRIKRLRLEQGMSQEELAKRSGYGSRSTINKIELGINDVPQSKIKAIAEALGVCVGDILIKRETSSVAKGKTIKIPVLGYVAAGTPITAIEEIVGYEEIPAGWEHRGQFYGLKIKGDSMSPTICNGDTVIVQQQSDVESGEIGIVIINGGEGTCKKIVKHENGITLIPLNAAYSPKFYTPEEVQELPLNICGKVVELRRKF